MKILEAILKSSNVDAVKGALVKVGVRGLTVLKVDGFGNDDLFTILDYHQVGDRVTAEVVREGKSHTVSLTLQAVE